MEMVSITAAKTSFCFLLPSAVPHTRTYFYKGFLVIDREVTDVHSQSNQAIDHVFRVLASRLVVVFEQLTNGETGRASLTELSIESQGKCQRTHFPEVVHGEEMDEAVPCPVPRPERQLEN